MFCNDQILKWIEQIGSSKVYKISVIFEQSSLSIDHQWIKSCVPIHPMHCKPRFVHLIFDSFEDLVVLILFLAFIYFISVTVIYMNIIMCLLSPYKEDP